MRTRSIRRLLWIAGFACLWLNVFDDPPLHTGAYLQDVTKTSAIIAKVTAEPMSLTVAVAKDGEVIARIAGPSQRRHALRVTGLEPATRYEYELAGAQGSERGSFTTAPDRDDVPVRFTFCGDSGDQPWWVWLQRTPILHLPARWGWFPAKSAVTRVGAGVAGYAPDFALHLGDLIYPKGLHAHYSSGFFRPFGDLIRCAPMYPVVGNHDVMDAAGQQVLANFHPPPSAATGDGRCFTFAWGPVRIIALDCNTHYAGDRYQDGHPTSVFLIEQLAACEEPWVVVASHFPIRSASRQGDSGELMLSLLPDLEKWQVSLYLSGHDHCYQRFGPDDRFPVPLVVSGGGGKQLYEIRRESRAAPLAAELVKAYHWCSAETSGDTLQVQAHRLDGGTLDAFQLSLPRGDALDRLRQRNPRRAARIETLQNR